MQKVIGNHHTTLPKAKKVHSNMTDYTLICTEKKAMIGTQTIGIDERKR